MTEEFGEHTKAAKEVVELVESGTLLSGGTLPEDVDAVVIHDLDQIPTYEDYEKYGDDRLIWFDIRQEAAGEYNGALFEKWGDRSPFDPHLIALLEAWTDRFRRELPDEAVARSINYEVVDDLYGCLKSRVFMDRENQLFEAIFKVYQSGGYPCGWDGKYPEGKMIVYYPE